MHQRGRLTYHPGGGSPRLFTVKRLAGRPKLMRRHDLVGADVANADSLRDEADDVDRQLLTGERADDATERTGRNVAVLVEQPDGLVQLELTGCVRSEHNSYLTPGRPNRYGCGSNRTAEQFCSNRMSMGPPGFEPGRDGL